MRRAALRSIAGRMGMACYAVWVALALATQGAVPCPTHDPHAAAALATAASMATSMSAPMSMNGMMRHGAHGSMDGAHHGGHPHAHHACTCVGCGCCVAMLDLCAPPRALVPLPAALARGAALPLPPRVIAAPGADRRLPFANAPPAGARVPV